MDDLRAKDRKEGRNEVMKSPDLRSKKLLCYCDYDASLARPHWICARPQCLVLMRLDGRVGEHCLPRWYYEVNKWWANNVSFCHYCKKAINVRRPKVKG